MEVFLVVWKNVPIVALFLFLISSISLGIFIERLANVKKSKVLPKNWKQIKVYLLNGNYEAALALLKKDKKPLSRILANILELYIKGEISKVELRQMIEGEAGIIRYELAKRISFISASVTLATLLGLIGTVFGLIEVFSAFSFSTPEGFKLLAKGIATSLNSTALGLLVAIFNYLLYWFINTRVDAVYAKILKELEEMLELIK